MRSKKYYAQNAAIIVLALSIIVMSIGYAAYSTQLQLKGVTTIQSSKWSILLQNPTKYSTTTIADDKITKLEIKDLAVNFAAEMSIDDTFSFTVDVVNDGTFDAKLTGWSLTAKNTATNEAIAVDENKTGASNSYLTYSVRWLDGTALAENDPLKHKVTGKNDNIKKLLVTVQTHKPANAADLPETNQSFEFDFKMNYGTIF